jgi:hypothetical protein
VARIESVEYRLLNWARWKAGRSIRYASSNPDNAGMPRDPWAEAPIPTSDCEASETDDAIDEVLSPEQRITVYVVYLGAGTGADALRHLGCSKSAMHDRIGAAHRKLADHFAEAAVRARDERERVERLQRMARP